jgi:Cu2+-exporting ATPase
VSTQCWHCGLPVSANPPQARTPDGPRDACCPGCAAAIETIHDLGLGEYYQWRTGENPLTPPADADARSAELSVFEIPELIEPWLEDNDDARALTLLIEGIHCAACAWLIEKALLELPGVERAALNLTNHRLRVRWRRDQDTTARTIAARLLDLGYRPRLPARDARLASEQRQQRMLLIRILVAALGTMQAMMLAVALYSGAFHDMAPLYRDLFRWFSLIVATPVVFFAGWPFLVGAWRGLRARAPGMDLPVTLALLLGLGGSAASTIAGGEHVYYESISMFVFFLLGSRWLEQRARHRVTLALSHLRDTLPLSVRRREADGQYRQIPATTVCAGDELIFNQGEVIAVDGHVTEGRARLDEAVVTGEFRPRECGPDDQLVAGSKVVEGDLCLRAAGGVDQNRVARIGRLVDQAREQRHTGTDRASRIVPGFVGAIVVLAGATFALHGGSYSAFEHALAVLVVACPCALALAAPLSLSAALDRALREGILVADPEQLFRVPELTDALLDKTGTLTRGEFTVVREQLLDTSLNEAQLRALVAGMEQHARHPAGRALADLATPASVAAVQYQSGMEARAQGHHWHLTAAPEAYAGHAGETTVALFRDQCPVMLFFLADPVRAEAQELCSQLTRSGLRLHLASGDRAQAVAPVAEQCGIADWRAGLTPEAKLDWLHNLQTHERTVMMTGDGINDAPALAAADLSVAMAAGPALTRESAGLYLMDDALSALARLRPLALRARRILRQNLAWALGYNLLAVPFAMAGLVPPWLAAIGMSLSSLLVTVNASRLLRSPNRDPLPERSSAL